MIDKIVSVFRNLAVMGLDSQNFLGAVWITKLMDLTPSRYEREMALRVLALSPHYFYRHVCVEYKGLAGGPFREAEFVRNRDSRRVIIDSFVGPHIDGRSTVLDIGCGPGFLASHAAAVAKHVYAADISPGVLSCARVLNGGHNITYLRSDSEGYADVPDGSVDFVYSFAVVQHVTDDVFRFLLGICFEKMIAGASGVLHIVIDDKAWTTEREWTEDHSLVGRVKLHVGLNCFTRTRESVLQMMSDAGLNVTRVRLGKEVASEVEVDIGSQHLVYFNKTSE